MNRTIKEVTVKRYHLRQPRPAAAAPPGLQDFTDAYSFARRLKALGGLPPYEYCCRGWTSEPDRFIINPIHQMPGLNRTGRRPAGVRWASVPYDGSIHKLLSLKEMLHSACSGMPRANRFTSERDHLRLVCSNHQH